MANLQDTNNQAGATLSTQNLDTLPWFKQGWPWALIAIPFLTIVAGVITFILANDSSDSLVQDNYYKKGLAINSDLERIEQAKRLQLHAALSYDADSKLISLKLKSSEASPSNVRLKLSHPTLDKKDIIVPLSHLSSNEFVGEINEIEKAWWHVKVEDEQQTWLLKSRWLYPDKSSLDINAVDL